MDRIQTTQGTLARLGFRDSSTAERLLAEWGSGSEEILALLADVADPDLALSSLDRLAAVRPDLPALLLGSSALAHQLTRVLGAACRSAST